MPGYVDDDDAGLEQQPGFEAQGGLVVQQLFPPVPDDVLGDDHGDDVTGPEPGVVADVFQDRAGDLEVIAEDFRSGFPKGVSAGHRPRL